MTAEEALALVKRFLAQECLSDIQQIVFRQSWAGHSYFRIASHVGSAPDYIKDIGFKLWQLLSKNLGKRVTKKNIRLVLQEIWDNQSAKELLTLAHVASSSVVGVKVAKLSPAATRPLKPLSSLDCRKISAHSR